MILEITPKFHHFKSLQTRKYHIPLQFHRSPSQFLDELLGVVILEVFFLYIDGVHSAQLSTPVIKAELFIAEYQEIFISGQGVLVFFEREHC